MFQRACASVLCAYHRCSQSSPHPFRHGRMARMNWSWVFPLKKKNKTTWRRRGQRERTRRGGKNPERPERRRRRPASRDSGQPNCVPGGQAVVPPDWGALPGRREDQDTGARGSREDSRRHRAEREAAHDGSGTSSFHLRGVCTTRNRARRNAISGFGDRRGGLGGRGDGNILHRGQ